MLFYFKEIVFKLGEIFFFKIGCFEFIIILILRDGEEEVGRDWCVDQVREEEDNVLGLEQQYLWEVGWVKGRFDDFSINGQDGEDDIVQEDKGKFVDIFDVYKYYSGYVGEYIGVIYTYIV